MFTMFPIAAVLFENQRLRMQPARYHKRKREDG